MTITVTIADDARAIKDADTVARRMRTLGTYRHLVSDDGMPLVRDTKPTEDEREERF